MSWQLDLADGPVFGVQIVEGNPRQVAVWLSASSLQFYAVDGGALYDALELDPPAVFDPLDDAWRGFVDGLRAPHGDYLPYVVTPEVTLYTSYDGRLRLYWNRGHRLTLESDGRAADLPCDDGESAVVAVGLDRDLGTVAAVTATQVHIFQQHVYVGRYPLDGIAQQGQRAVFVPDAAGEVVLVNERGAQIIDLSGRVQARLDGDLPGIAVSACAPEGRLLAVGERDRSMLRIYDAWLNVLFQGSAQLLLDSAQKLQLMVRSPVQGAQLEALAVADDGVLVFALGGIVCCSHVELLPEMPYPNALL